MHPEVSFISWPGLQVVDETDRMLRQAYQDWLPHVLKAVEGEEQGDGEEGAGVAASKTEPEPESHAPELADVAGTACHLSRGDEWGSGAHSIPWMVL